MNDKQLQLIASLQQSEFKRFRSIADVRVTASRNPVGLRFANIECAFSVIAASRFVGWEQVETGPEDFIRRACDCVIDYLNGDHIESLPKYKGDELQDSEQAETWFDFVQLGLYIALIGNHRDVVDVIANWVSPSMKYDSGIEDVSQSVNQAYTALCIKLRDGFLSDDACKTLKATKGSARDQHLVEMLIAIDAADAPNFLTAVHLFEKQWKPNFRDAHLHEILSVDASNLCNVWQLIHGHPLADLRAKTHLHLAHVEPNG